MLPDYIADEISRRLRSGKLNEDEEIAIAREMEIDLKSALSPTPLAEEAALDLKPLGIPDGPIFRGSVEFDLRTECMGGSRLLRCRALFAATLSDQEDALTGRPKLALGAMANRSEVLVWDEDRPAPIWRELDWSMLPSAAVEQIDCLIEQQIAAERCSTS